MYQCKTRTYRKHTTDNRKLVKTGRFCTFLTVALPLTHLKVEKPMRKSSRNGFEGQKATVKNSLVERNIVPILDIPVDSTRKGKVLGEVLHFLGSEVKRKLLVTTPNPEIIVAASKNADYKIILQSASLSLPDGIGVVLAQRFLSTAVSDVPILRLVDILRSGARVGLSVFFNRKWLFTEGEVVPGRVVFEELVELAAQKGWKVYFLGGRRGVASAASRRLISNFHFPISNQFKVADESGPWLDQRGDPANQQEAKVEKETIEKINKFKPDLLFVAFGPPKQEIWLSRHLGNLNVRVAMVVGGSFDYAAGVVPTPPEWVRQAGLEWLWRIFTQPWRAKRIATALFVFPWLVFRSKLNKH